MQRFLSCSHEHEMMMVSLIDNFNWSSPWGGLEHLIKCWQDRFLTKWNCQKRHHPSLQRGREFKNQASSPLTSGAIQGKVPTTESLVVCWWNLDDPKSQILAVKSAAITTARQGATWCWSIHSNTIPARVLYSGHQIQSNCVSCLL